MQIKYDNLTAAVKQVVIGEGRGRVENDRWVVFRSHYYGFDPFYCLPGIDGAHEKGGVEGDVGRFRPARSCASRSSSGSSGSIAASEPRTPSAG